MNLCKSVKIGAIAALAVSIFQFTEADAEKLNVVATIKPVHSLVAAVMEGTGEPDIIVDGNSSPHGFSLKPSHAEMLESADIVFWIGHELESFLEKPIESIGTDAISIELFDSGNLTLHPVRSGGYFERHDHDHEEDHHEDDHDHDHEAEHSDDHHDEDHDHEHEAEHHEEGHEHEDDHHDEDHDEHEHEEDHHDEDHDYDTDRASLNPHIWLDPINAKEFVHVIEETLALYDQENAGKYRENAKKVLTKLDGLVEEVNQIVEPVKGKGFLVFHDAYQNFEFRFDVRALGSLTVNPEVLPGAERLAEIHDKIDETGVECIFSEPQFSEKIVNALVEDKNLRTGELDPLGSNFENGPDLYFGLIRNMATSMRDCLGSRS